VVKKINQSPAKSGAFFMVVIKMSRKGNSGKKNRIVQLYSENNFAKYENDAAFGRYPREEKDLIDEIFNAPIGTKLISWHENYPNEKTISEIKYKNGEKYLAHISGHDRGKNFRASIDVWLSNPNWKTLLHNGYYNNIHDHIWGNYAQIVYPKKKGAKK